MESVTAATARLLEDLREVPRLRLDDLDEGTALAPVPPARREVSGVGPEQPAPRRDRETAVAGLRDLRPSREEREGWPVGPECPERLDEVVEEGELSLLAVRMDEPETRIEACRCEGAVAGRVEEPAEAVERRDRPEVCSATI